MAMPNHDKRRTEAGGFHPVNIAVALVNNLGRLGQHVYQTLPHPFATIADFVEEAGRKSEPWLEREMGLDEQRIEDSSPDPQQE